MKIVWENIITFAAFQIRLINNSQTMKRSTFCAIMVIASLTCAAQTEIRRPECAITKSDWERLHTKPDYFLQILSIQDSMMAIFFNHNNSMIIRIKMRKNIFFHFLYNNACTHHFTKYRRIFTLFYKNRFNKQTYLINIHTKSY